MKAAYFERHGGPEVMKYGELPDPVAGPGEVIVDIHAASINGADWKVRSGEYSQITEFPYILGRDFSGVVGAIGDGVHDFRVGDAVFGVCDVGQEGTYAEKIAMKASIIARKPDSISHKDIAALALIGLTAQTANTARSPSFHISWGAISRGSSARSVTASTIFGSVMRCSASATWARRAPMRRRSR